MIVLQLIGLALVDSLSAGTLVIPLGLLLIWGRMRWRSYSVYLSTVALVYLMLGVGLLFGLRVVFDVASELQDERWFSWVKLVLGVALAAYGILSPNPKKKPSGTSPVKQRLGSAGPAAMVGLGLTAAVAEAATMLPYLAAMAITQDLSVAFPFKILVVVFYCLVMILPAVVIGIGAAKVGSLTSPRFQRFTDRMQYEAKVTVLWIAAIVGVWLAQTSFWELN
ncbi:MAG TPA: GAP family protein [Candidatus Corynebacterium gallistercoris]|uniref:GAP family protein n=1 Tax=Candidatus Corynebacterium gallistercoris TaxID=2838530 RepID=A0A9D1RX90_9CORY|nr:GAP family protein [Candidatus Corynebacterium gallistercoris]